MSGELAQYAQILRFILIAIVAFTAAFFATRVFKLGLPGIAISIVIFGALVVTLLILGPSGLEAFGSYVVNAIGSGNSG